MFRKAVTCVVSATLVLSGCATSSKEIAAIYVSPLQYQSLDCDQMGAEALRIQSRIQQVGGRLDQAAENDKALTAVGIVLFWPALFFLGGTKQQEAEFARLKGEYDALHQAAVHKRCDGIMTAAPVAPAAPVASETTRTATPESSFPR